MPRVNLLYVHSADLGYGRMGVKLAEAIERSGVDVYDDMPNGISGPEKFIPHGAKTATCGHVAWLSTPGHCRGWWKGQTRSILTMWESSVLPEPFRESLDEFETVVVPSEQNLELFSKYHTNVKYVPLGIDPTEWYPVKRPEKGGIPFTFFISGGGFRKGSDLVIDAFLKVFGDRGDVARLFIHSARSSELPHDDRIHLITGKLSDVEERALYSMAHCFVFPSRGEGFGLRPLQAIAQGTPTIATDAHGHKAFSHLLTHALPWHQEQTPDRSFHHGPAGSWWEPDFDALCEAMLDVYENYEERLVGARFNAQVAIETLNWDETARKYLDAIGRHNLELPDVEQTEWVEPEIRRYLVRVQTPRFFEVGGVQYIMEPGKDYWEAADVKRVLYDGGHLDPSCLGGPEDAGLTREQYEAIPQYTASHAFCPTCHQRLNTNMPTLEELEALPMPRGF